MGDYTFQKVVDLSIDEAEEKVSDALKDRGFGVLTRIDVKETLHEKLDVDFRPYRILGACNPENAHSALLTEPRIGTMLPCNVVVQAVEGGTEIAAIDPLESMRSVDNEELRRIAGEIRDQLADAIESV